MIFFSPPPGASLPQILDALQRAFIPVVSHDEAAPRVVLRSPNGTSYAVTVDDAGVLKTEVLSGKSRP